MNDSDEASDGLSGTMDVIVTSIITANDNSPDVRPSFESMASMALLLEMHNRNAADIPLELIPHYSGLIESDIEEDLVREILTTLPFASTFDDTEVISKLTTIIEQEFRCGSSIQPEPGRREIVTVIGPTGVGKTTTIAKLAGQLQLNEGRRVGLIAVDHYRVGAIDQLKTYAEILQAPIRSASTPDELLAAIDSLNDVDVILIDTAGRSPKDAPKRSELVDILNVAQSDHVLLVLSLAGGAEHLENIADQFGFARPTSLVVSKLDEAFGCGGLLSIARQIPVPISYVTTGQDVPSQIEPATPTRLAELVLGTAH